MSASDAVVLFVVDVVLTVVAIALLAWRARKSHGMHRDLCVVGATVLGFLLLAVFVIVAGLG
ncbi:MAG: hypothetical protein ABR562_06570, partial [Thermoplasmatota archaeon]